MRALWATARQTLIEAVRNRLTAVILAALVALVLLLQFVARAGSATLAERVQAYLAYSLAGGSALLAVLTVLLGCRMLCGEVENRSIFLPMTKPVRRWVHVLGRWLGLVILQLLLVTVLGLAVYAMTQNMRRQVGDDRQIARANAEVFVARARSEPVDYRQSPRFRAAVEARKKELQDQGQWEQAVASLGSQQAAQAAVENDIAPAFVTAGPQGALQWEFRGLQKPVDGQDVMLKLEYRLLPSAMPADGMVYVGWLAESHDGRVSRPFEFSESVGDLTIRPNLMIPADVIDDTGIVRLTFVNPNNLAITIPQEDMFLSYPAGSFTPNLFRGMILVWFVQTLLAAVALLAASFLSFPVACLGSFFVLLMGFAASFVADSTGPSADMNFLATAGHYAARLVYFVLPDFARSSPTSRLTGGELISWSSVGLAALRFLVVQPALSLALAGFLFSRRELARVTA